MADAAEILIKAAMQGGRETVATLDQIDAGAKKVEKSTDGAAKGMSRLERQIREAEKVMKEQEKLLAANVVHFDAYYQASQRDFHSQWVRGASQFVEASTKAGRGARLASHEVMNLGRQMADLGTMAAMGASPLMLIASQGPQIADVFATAKSRGVGVKDALSDIAISSGRVLASWGPLIALGGTLAAGFLIWRNHADTLAEALEKTAEAAENFAKVQGTVTDALGQAATFTEKYKVANSGLTAALDGMISSQNSAYMETMAGIGAMDGASQAAARRAELERLATVAILRRAAAEAEARAKESDAAKETARKGAFGQGLITALGFSGSPEMLSMAQQAQATEFKRLGGEAAAKAAQQERDWAKALREQAEALMGAKLVIPEVTKATSDHAKAAREVAKVEKATKDVAAERAAEARAQSVAYLLAIRTERAEWGLSANAIKERNDALAEMIALANGDWDLAEQIVKETTEYREQKRVLDELIDIAEQRDKSLSDYTDGLEEMRKTADKLSQAFADIQYSVDDMFASMRRGDIGGFLQNIHGLVSGIGTMLQQGPQGYAALGSMAANAIGGKTGRAIGGGLGIAGAGLGVAGYASSIGGAAALGGLGLSASAIVSIAQLAGPIGLAAGALYAAAKLLNVGGKPSNEGAGYSLVTGQFSGNKRTSDTEEAAKTAGDAIQGVQDTLRAAGIGLTDAVHGLVIGSRDLTQIYLTSGRTLYSAVGDSGAAVDAATRAILEGANYVSDAQKQLVMSALDAGKGFDAVAEVLAKYKSAQGIGASLDDEILRLTNAREFDLKQVRDAIALQRQSYIDLADQGIITADLLTSYLGKLAAIEGLQTAEVVKRYTVAANDNTEALAKAKETLADAYQRERSEIEATIARIEDLSGGLRDFVREIDFGEIGGRSPVQQLIGLRMEFARLASLALANDPDAAARLPSLSRDLLRAERNDARNAAEYRIAVARVREATEAAAKVADTSADIARKHLEMLDKSVSGILKVDNSVISVREALLGYGAAAIAAGDASAAQAASIALEQLDVMDKNLTALGVVNQSVLGIQAALLAFASANAAVTGNERPKYLTGVVDVPGILDSVLGGTGPNYGAIGGTYGTIPLSEIIQSGRPTGFAGGFMDSAIGSLFPGFAAGGDHMGGWRLVGERGPELEATGPARIFSAAQTREMLSGGGADAAAIERLERRVAQLTSVVEQMAAGMTQVVVNTGKTARQLDQWDDDGMPPEREEAA